MVAVAAKALLRGSAATWITAPALFTAIKHQNAPAFFSGAFYFFGNKSFVCFQ